jgi:hypothetical protein
MESALREPKKRQDMLKLGKQSLTGDDSQTMLHLENEGQSFEIVLGGPIPLLGFNGMSWETA